LNDEQVIIPETYVIDANVLIEAKNRYYAFDICPAFWDSLLINHAKSRIESIDKVKKEINDGNYGDEIKKWIKATVPPSFFCATDDNDVIKDYQEIINWVMHQPQYFLEAKEEFANGADGWLIAHVKAQKDNKILVTHEVLNLESKKRVPIPNVCTAFGVKWKNTFEMLRELKTQFVLPKD
jgi:hypothetical protein